MPTASRWAVWVLDELGGEWYGRWRAEGAASAASVAAEFGFSAREAPGGPSPRAAGSPRPLCLVRPWSEELAGEVVLGLAAWRGWQAFAAPGLPAAARNWECLPRLGPPPDVRAVWAGLLDREDVLIVDTETTGLGRRAEVVSIAIVDTRGRTRYSDIVMPQGSIRKAAQQVHGLSRAELRAEGAAPWPEHHARVCGLLHGGVVALAYNAHFDSRLIDQTAKRYGLAPPACTWRCLMQDYSRHRFETAGIERLRWKLVDALADEGVAGSRRAEHGAFEDCHLALALMQGVAGGG